MSDTIDFLYKLQVIPQVKLSSWSKYTCFSVVILMFLIDTWTPSLSENLRSKIITIRVAHNINIPKIGEDRDVNLANFVGYKSIPI